MEQTPKEHGTNISIRELVSSVLSQFSVSGNALTDSVPKVGELPVLWDRFQTGTLMLILMHL